LLEKYEEIIQAIHKDAQESSNRDAGRSKILIRWHSPPAGWTLLNTDGASKGNPGRAGGGGVLRGDKGEWICGFGESMRVCTTMKAEIKVVLRGLKIAKSLDITRLWVQVDSFNLVELLKGESHSCAEHAPIVSQCRAIINHEGSEVLISHCYREANKIADALANIGCNLTSGLAMYD